MADRITKAAAVYREPAPNLARRCGTCSMFRPPRSCTLVKGDISAKGVCKFWESKR